MTAQGSETTIVRARVSDERGVALFLTLILVSTLSVLTVSLMFLAQSESFSSGNYRLMTQARYGAEAGVQKAADYIMNTDFTGPLTGLYPNTQSPVQYNFKELVLSSDPNHPSNFPDATTSAAFQAATNGTIVAGTSTISYTAYATLLSVSQIQDGYTGVTKLVQTWQITSDATIAGIRKSTVEVSAILDSDKVPTIAYGAFGTDPGCGSLSFSGHVKTNSYDSSQIDPSTGKPFANPPEFGTGGDVGTNGNMTINGNVDVNGNLSSPQQGVGACTTGNVTACTGCSLSFAQGSMIHLPQVVQLPTPPIPTPATGAPASLPGATCLNLVTAAQFAAGACSISGNVITLKNVDMTPLSLPSLNIANATLVLTASSTPGVTNTYNINSVNLSNTNSFLQVQSPATGYGVKINLTGLNGDGTPVSGSVLGMAGGSTLGGYVQTDPSYQCTGCSQYDASLLEFMYGGTGNLDLHGNPSAAMVFYAPNAQATFSGNSGLYGALVAKDLAINGGGNTININYDQSLTGKGQTASAPMLASFSWKKY